MARRSKSVLARGEYLQLIREGHWEYADRVKGRAAVAIVAVTENQELVLTQQFRIPLGKQVIDLAAGLVGDEAGDEHEPDQQAAERELLEETGFRAPRWEKIFTGPLSAGMTTELVTFYLARDSKQVQAGGGAGNEDIRVHIVPLSKIAAWLKRKATARTLIDPKVYAALGILGLYDHAP